MLQWHPRLVAVLVTLVLVVAATAGGVGGGPFDEVFPDLSWGW